jgi:hypothetical protein
MRSADMSRRHESLGQSQNGEIFTSYRARSTVKSGAPSSIGVFVLKRLIANLGRLPARRPALTIGI